MEAPSRDMSSAAGRDRACRRSRGDVFGRGLANVWAGRFAMMVSFDVDVYVCVCVSIDFLNSETRGG